MVLSIGNNPVAVFIVLSGIIALNDIGMLCFVFIPKIMFMRKGVDEGVNVGETILKSTHRRASTREASMRLPSSGMLSSRFSGISGRFSSGIDGSEEKEDQKEENPMFSSIESRLPTSLEHIKEELEESEVTGERTRLAVPDTSPSTGSEDECERELDNKTEETRGLLQAKYDEVMLKNYDLENAIEQAQERERQLMQMVHALEHQLSANIKHRDST